LGTWKSSNPRLSWVPGSFCFKARPWNMEPLAKHWVGYSLGKSTGNHGKSMNIYRKPRSFPWGFPALFSLKRIQWDPYFQGWSRATWYSLANKKNQWNISSLDPFTVADCWSFQGLISMATLDSMSLLVISPLHFKPNGSIFYAPEVSWK
jgi:hypothetical protein